MKEFPEDSIDLVLTDPPYGKIYGSKTIGGSRMATTNIYNCDWDVIPDRKVFKLIFSISKNQIIFGYNYLADLLSPTNALIVWDKKEKNNWFDNFSDGEILWTSFNKPLRIFRFLWMGALRRGKKPREFIQHKNQLN